MDSVQQETDFGITLTEAALGKMRNYLYYMIFSITYGS